MLRNEIAVGDGVLFYHSSAEPPAVAGTARVVRAGYPDPTQFDPRDEHFDRDSPRDDPRWYAVDIKFESEVRARGDAARAARRARARRDGAAAPGQPAVGAAGDRRASGSRSSRWARKRVSANAPRPAHARRPPRRDPGARSRGDGGVLRRRARPAGAAALAGRGRRALDLVRPRTTAASWRSSASPARRARTTAGTPTSSASTWSRSRSSAATRDAWEAHLTAAGHPIVHRTDYTLYVRDPEGNRVGLSHWPDATSLDRRRRGVR